MEFKSESFLAEDDHVNDHPQISKTTSNFQKAKKVIKKYLCICLCCFCPKLQLIDCCGSCEIEIHNNLESVL